MISIIMPSYDPNVAKVSETVSGILTQDAEIEIILVLQHTDSSKVAALRGRLKDTRVKVIDDDGVGISRSRNIGVQNSNGKWLLFLDDDIQLEPATLKAIQDSPEYKGEKGRFFYGNLFVIGTRDNYLNFPLTGRKVGVFSYNRVCSVMLIIEKELFHEIGPFDERMGSGTYFGAYEESDIVVKALLVGETIQYLPFYTAYHESADYEVEKVVKYARGTGAFYRKYWLQKSRLLDLKLTLDLLLRVILTLTLKKKRIFWFKGFWEGFRNFNTSNA